MSPDLPIVLIDGVRYHLTTPESEAWLEKVIQSNSEHIFGPDSFYFEKKKLIRSNAGVASIPDGYVIFFTPKARWAIVEVELASHPVYQHVITQLTSFNRGIKCSATRGQLVEELYKVFDDNEVLKARLKQKVKGDVHKFISDLVSENPLIVVVIDQKTEELAEAVEEIKGDVQVVEFRTFRREGVSDDENAFVFEPLSTQVVSPPKARGGPQPRSGPEPEFSEFGAPNANSERSGRVTIDGLTEELLRRPEGITLSDLHREVCKAFPSKDPNVLLKTTRRRLSGHLRDKLGIKIVKDEDGKYSIK